jgi:hypothetical protein
MLPGLSLLCEDEKKRKIRLEMELLHGNELKRETKEKSQVDKSTSKGKNPHGLGQQKRKEKRKLKVNWTSNC